MSAKTIRHDGRLAFAAVCGAAAIAYLTIGLVRNDHWLAFGGFAVMLGYGTLLLVFRKRGEPLALLSGNAADERQAQLMLRASAATAQVLVVVLVAGAMITLATGSRYSWVFCGLCAVGGCAFIAATVWYSRRG
ncbi:MAG: hypothetical protein ACRDWT_13360 [Jatrophihabitantaceae bacterium]